MLTRRWLSSSEQTSQSCIKNFLSLCNSSFFCSQRDEMQKNTEASTLAKLYFQVKKTILDILYYTFNSNCPFALKVSFNPLNSFAHKALKLVRCCYNFTCHVLQDNRAVSLTKKVHFDKQLTFFCQKWTCTISIKWCNANSSHIKFLFDVFPVLYW